MTHRRRFTPEQKATIVRRHLAGKEPVSNLSEELGIQPSQIHLWVKQVLDQAERAFLPGDCHPCGCKPGETPLGNPGGDH